MPRKAAALLLRPMVQTIDCRGHDHTIHQPLARRNIGRSGGCMPTSIGNDPGEENPFWVSPDATCGICLVYGLGKYSHL